MITYTIAELQETDEFPNGDEKFVPLTYIKTRLIDLLQELEMEQ